MQANVGRFAVVANFLENRNGLSNIFFCSSGIPFQSQHLSCTRKGFSLPSATAEPAADLKCFLIHLFCFVVLPESKRHVTEADLCQRLPVLIADLTIGRQRLPVSLARPRQVTLIEKDATKIVIFIAKAELAPCLSVDFHSLFVAFLCFQVISVPLQFDPFQGAGGGDAQPVMRRDI